MKVLDAFLFVAFVMYFILSIAGYSICDLESANDKEKTPTNIELYQYKDIVYIYPDSTRATIEDGIFLIKKNKKENKREVIIESYTIIYTDKTGKINRLKDINPEFILSGERYTNGKIYKLIPTYKSK